MISALLTASLQTMNTLKDVQESIETKQLNKADIDSALFQNLSPINEKLDKIIEEQQRLSNKITMVEAKTQQTTTTVKEIDDNLTVAIQGITAIMNNQHDGKTIISEYESTYLADIVNAIVTTQSNVKAMAKALQAINDEMKQGDMFYEYKGETIRYEIYLNQTDSSKGVTKEDEEITTSE